MSNLSGIKKADNDLGRDIKIGDDLPGATLADDAQTGDGLVNDTLEDDALGEDAEMPTWYLVY